MNRIIMCCLMLISVSLHAHSEPEIEKVYISPHDIFIEANQILVRFDQEWAAVDSVFSDANGIFLQIDGKRDRIRWVCRNCSWNNYGTSEICENCGNPRPATSAP